MNYSEIIDIFLLEVNGFFWRSENDIQLLWIEKCVKNGVNKRKNVLKSQVWEMKQLPCFGKYERSKIP